MPPADPERPRVLLVTKGLDLGGIERVVVDLSSGLLARGVPVEVALVKGKNVLHFSRGGANIRGLTLKEFTLAPVK